MMNVKLSHVFASIFVAATGVFFFNAPTEAANAVKPSPVAPTQGASDCRERCESSYDTCVAAAGNSRSKLRDCQATLSDCLDGCPPRPRR